MDWAHHLVLISSRSLGRHDIDDKKCKKTTCYWFYDVFETSRYTFGTEQKCYYMCRHSQQYHVGECIICVLSIRLWNNGCEYGFSTPPTFICVLLASARV